MHPTGGNAYKASRGADSSAKLYLLARFVEKAECERWACKVLKEPEFCYHRPEEAIHALHKSKVRKAMRKMV